MRPLSVIIPSWNGRELLEGLFASLAGLEWLDGDRIIVVDQGSSDGSGEWLRQLARLSRPLVEVVELGENRGFACAVNEGIARASSASDIVVLNNDTVITDPELFFSLRRIAKAFPKLGVLSPLVLDRRGRIQAHGACHLPFSHLGKDLCTGEGKINQFPGLRECEVVPFVCAFLRRECLEEVGGLDESFFAYFEDSDFCLRARRAGWRVASTTEAEIIHLGPATTTRRIAREEELYKESHRIFERMWGAELDQRFSLEVVWVGELGYSTGYGYWSRHAMRGALESGIRTFHQPARLPPDMEKPSPEIMTRDCQGHMGSPDMPQILIEHGARFTRASGRYKIGWTMSDVEPWPRPWLEGVRWVDEVWVPTECDARRLAASGVETPVHVVPLGVDPGYFHPDILPWEWRPPVDFLFISLFQWGVRKRPDLLISAFRDEFSPQEDVGLLIKTGTAKEDEKIQYQTRWWLRREGPPVWITTDPVEDWQLGGFYALGDCFVLPTMGEGWCLPAMEALATGVPVIITGWGPPREWGSDREGKPLPGMHFIDYSLVECRSDIPLYRGSRWAEPDYHHLRKLLRTAYESRRSWRDEARAGSSLVRERFSWRKVGERIRERLEAIEG